jgi:integrase
MPKPVSTTHPIVDNELVIHKRGRSRFWQCRFKVDKKWQRKSTGESELDKAKKRALDFLYEAKALSKLGHPALTRRFKDVAKLAIKRLEDEAENDRGLRKHRDYLTVINKYLIPFFGNYNITSIDYKLLGEFDLWRIEKMGKKPSRSTLQTHNAALNRVFDEAVIRQFLTEAVRPSLKTLRGDASNRRPAFEVKEIQALLAGFDAWAGKKKHKKSKELALLLKDYVSVMLDTGARPGNELMNLKWNQIELTKEVIDKGETTDTNEDGTQVVYEETNEPIREVELLRECWITVTGKTGTRTILGNRLTIAALERIAARNFENAESKSFWLEEIVTPKRDSFVFRLKDGSEPTSFQKLFEKYLDDHSLLIDTKTGDKHVFYSLRHTYATLRLTLEGTAIHTLAKHMGTSVQMIEKHYSHLQVKEAKEQLRGEKVGALLRSLGNIDGAYKPKKG